MKLKYINEKGLEKSITKGSHIVLLSPLEDNKIRHAYVLECDDPYKILIQMETTSDKLNTGEIVNINNKNVIIKYAFKIKINFYDPKVKLLNTKQEVISDSKIEEIKIAANKQLINEQNRKKINQKNKRSLSKTKKITNKR